VVDPEGLVPRPVAAQRVVVVRGGVAHDRVRDGVVDLLVGHVEVAALLRRKLDVDRLVVTVQEHVPPVGVPLDPLVMGDVHARTLPSSRRLFEMLGDGMVLDAATPDA
jgi:hypothetical protein